MKITKEHLESLITDKAFIRHGDRMTICVLTLKSGFQVVGKSACIDAANFDAAIGEQVAYDNAFEKLWELEGYRVKYDNGDDYIYRLLNERNQLKVRLDKLQEFLSREKPEFITVSEWELLKSQAVVMADYLQILDVRITNAGNGVI